MSLVEVFYRTTYGQARIYPANILAEQLAEFAGVKTFTTTHLAQLKVMAFEVAEVRDPRNARV